MYRQYFNVLLIVTYCLLSFSSNCFSADKVVVVPLGTNPFKGDQYYTISSAAFTIADEATTYQKLHFFSYSGYLELTSTLSAAVASVNLHDGAIVTEFTTYIKDVANGDRCDMRFNKNKLSDGTVATIGLTESPSADTDTYTSVSLQLPTPEVIDNQAYQYYLTWECGGLGTYDDLYAVRFKYHF